MFSASIVIASEHRERGNLVLRYDMSIDWIASEALPPRNDGNTITLTGMVQ